MNTPGLGAERTAHVSHIAAKIRCFAAQWALRANGGYLAQACGTAEVLALLHSEVLSLGPSRAPFSPPRFASTPSPGNPGIRGEDWLGDGPDLLIISPAHYATAHYATLAAMGRLDPEALSEHSNDGGLLEMIGAEHSPGMVVTSGSLGIALGVAVGRAIARKRMGIPGAVWVLISDGELQEGSTWESLQLAVSEGLDNLRIVLDRNNMQVDGKMQEVMAIGDVATKLRSFNLTVHEHDAHDIDGLFGALSAMQTATGPAVLVSNSEPWRGFSFLPARWETNKLHFVRLTPEESTLLESEVEALWQQQS
jgi:transketolase